MARPAQTFDYVLANPTFRAAEFYEPHDLAQHICTMLKMTGTAAFVVPDNMLFDVAGETVRHNR